MDLVRNFYRPLITILFFFLILFVYSKLAGPIPFSVNSVNTNKTDAFTVSGTGKSSAKPDMAVVTVGVSANATTVETAQEQMNGNINKVIEVIKKLGIKAEDIKTTNYSVNPITDFREGSQKINGYSANTNVSIKVRDTSKANSVVDAATGAGANQIGGVSFEVSDKTKAENETREMAVKEAKKKAEDAARIAGFKLGRIVNYSEELPFGGPIPLRAQSSSEAADKSTNIEPGTSDIEVTVTLSYEIR
jgi:uncharacterized protein